jgi:hypothetical protein
VKGTGCTISEVTGKGVNGEEMTGLGGELTMFAELGALGIAADKEEARTGVAVLAGTGACIMGGNAGMAGRAFCDESKGAEATSKAGIS